MPKCDCAFIVSILIDISFLADTSHFLWSIWYYADPNKPPSGYTWGKFSEKKDCKCLVFIKASQICKKYHLPTPATHSICMAAESLIFISWMAFQGLSWQRPLYAFQMKRATKLARMWDVPLSSHQRPFSHNYKCQTLGAQIVFKLKRQETEKQSCWNIWSPGN